MTFYLLLAAAIIVACVVFHGVSGKLGIPMLFAFILLGMIFGSDGLLKIPFDDYGFAEQICTIALIFIMFYGGFGTNWTQAKPVAVHAVLLSSLGTIITAGLVGVFCYFVLRVDILESLLLGAVISSTDAASVFSILRSRRLNLKYGTASLLEVESGSNDPFSYMLTILILSLMNGETSGGEFVLLVVSQILFGVLFGVAIAYAAAVFVKRFSFTTLLSPLFYLPLQLCSLFKAEVFPYPRARRGSQYIPCCPLPCTALSVCRGGCPLYDR